MFSSCAGPRRGRSCWRRQSWISDGALCASWVGGPHPAPRRGRATRDGSRTDGMGPLRLAEKTPWGEVGWQAWNRRGEGSSTGGLAWSGPDPVWVQGRGGGEGVSPSAGTSRPPTPGGLLGSAASLSRGETLHRATEPRLCPATLPASRLQTSPRAHSGGRLRSGSWLLSQSGPRLALRLVISRPTPQRSRGLAVGWPQTWLAPQKS